LATPWTPPATIKNNNNVKAGSLLPAQYANYASYLNSFAAYMKSGGTPLKVISVQNEPDISTTSESCLWSAAQFLSFFRTNASAITNAPVMMPESFRYDFSLSDSTLNDSVAVTNVDYVGGHLYGVTTITDYANAHNKGKLTWMTEYLLNDQTLISALATAKQIHDCLTIGNMSAYIWWKDFGDSNGLVNASGVPQKRGFLMSQWSRFVHPGYYRISASNTGSAAFISAYQNATNGSFAIVAINTNTTTAISQTFALTNFPTATLVTPYITSATMSRSNQTPVTLINSSFAYTLPPLSMVTFVGNAFAVVLTSSANPATYGNPITFTATVQTNGVAVGGISGEPITFYDGAMLLGTGTLNGSGQATYATTATQFPAFTHSIKAVYAGDATYSNTTSAVFPQSVNPATLTPGLTGVVGKNYDGTTVAFLTADNYTLSGVAADDTVTLNNTAGNYNTRDTQGSGKTVIVTNLSISGVSATNYILSKTSISASIGSIYPTNITVTAAANTKVYDGTTGAATVPLITSGSVQTGDTAGFAETYGIPNVGIGNKTLTPSGVVNDNNAGFNYNYTFLPISTGTINAATLTVTNAVASNKVYDGTTNATLDATQAGLNGILNSDNVTLITVGMAGYFADASVETAKPVTVVGLTLGGADAGNYTLGQPTGLTASILALVTPVFANPAISGGAGGWQLNFSAQAGQNYRVLAADDLTLPLDQWTVLTNAMFDTSGAATFTDNSATNPPQRFYQIGSP
jgi:glucuronoarabinoxylan endo-1,4-beta-xylanase